MRRCGLVAALLLATAGCTMVAETVAGSAAVAVVDRAVSNYAGKECRVADLITTGAICKTAPPRLAAPVYCYRTLGAVDCYPEPDPYAAPPLPGLERPPAAPAPLPAATEPTRPAPVAGRSTALLSAEAAPAD